jgi:hypothetical protein
MFPRATRCATWLSHFLSAALLTSCSESSHPATGDQSDSGEMGGAGATDAAPRGAGGSAAGAGAGTGGGTDASSGDPCNQNRGSGIPVNSGTMSAKIDAQTVSGPGRMLWAAASNTLTLNASDGSTLVVIFPGCSAQTYSIPEDAAPPKGVSITYTGGGGDPQWACTYEDPNLGPASCTIDVTAYGARQNAPVTGTFSGVLRLRRGTGSSTKSVTAGTFTFGRP